MDYVVGSVAALITGNVTPNRPKLLRRALTPTKHQASPNVTPKSELVEDRSVFLSPTMQKKKAIVKKSPKRIFQNSDLDGTDGEESATSPKAVKVKKHLKDDLDGSLISPKSSGNIENSTSEDIQEVKEITPKKKKNKQVSNIEPMVLNTDDNDGVNATDSAKKSPKKKNKQNKTPIKMDVEIEDSATKTVTESNIKSPGKSPKKKNKKNKSKLNANVDESMQIDEQPPSEITNTQNQTKSPKKKNIQNKDNTSEIPSQKQETPQVEITKKNKNKKRKKKPNNNQSKPETNQTEIDTEENQELGKDTEVTEDNEDYVNPNAITEKDTDSEHESDDEIESENEGINKEVLDNANGEPAEESSDEEEEKPPKPEKKIKEKVEATEEEVKRTIFVGNVPFSSKCKKEIKKIFSKHGPIDTVRIRTIPVKDARVTPKLAVIKNELHPERSTVNVYVKFKDEVCVENALTENNTVLNGNHLRVTRSSHSGAEHEPALAVFVGNLPFALEDDTLRDKFQGCGEVVSVRIIRDRNTNAGKGFGYVNFASKDGVELALALSEEDLTIKNRILRVKRCTATQRPQTHQSRPPRQNQGNNENGGFKKFGNQAASQRGGFNKFGGKPGQFGGRGGGQFSGRGGGQFGGRGGSQFGGRGRGQFGGRGGGQFGGRGGGQFGGRPGGQFGGKPEGQNDDGAFRRIQNKRKFEEGNTEAPPNKRQKDINQPIKEKKVRKEFVGMTAEKKKKNKFDKGQKKKKALSEILTKRVQ